MSTVDKILANRACRAEATTRLDAELTELVKQALQEGYSPADLAEAIGVSRARIYQIRDGRR